MYIQIQVHTDTRIYTHTLTSMQPVVKLNINELLPNHLIRATINQKKKTKVNIDLYEHRT